MAIGPNGTIGAYTVRWVQAVPNPLGSLTVRFRFHHSSPNGDETQSNTIVTGGNNEGEGHL